MRNLLLLFLSSFCFALAYPQPGTLDTHFGNDGLVKSNLFYAGGATSGRKTFVLPDGKLLVVVQEGSRTSFARFLPDGSFDASFLDTDQYSTDVAYGDAAQDSDGRIVIAGTRYQDFAFTRYDAFGNIDLEFDVRFPEASTATAVAIQEDGKIVLAGYTYNGGVARFAVVRCLADGTLDSSFSGDGKQTTTNGNNGAFATAIAIQGDGKIVVGGYAGGYGARRDFSVVRYNTNGTRDLSFSDDGKQLTRVGDYDDIANAIAIQADGKILLTGRTQFEDGPFGQKAMATVRYNTNGSLDATFNGTGMSVIAIGTDAEAVDILVQNDTKIVVAATAGSFVLLRYNSNGSLDASTGNGGVRFIDFNQGNDQVSAALLTDGKILLTGWTDPAGGKLREIALARYTAAGNPDMGFNGDGKASQYFSTGGTAYNGIAVQEDGKLVAVGYTLSNYFYEDVHRAALARYNPDGTFDESFGIGGKVATQFGGFGSGGNAFALQSDGKIVVGGDIYNFGPEDSGEDILLARYNTNGELDHTFGNEGIAYIDFSDELGVPSSEYLSAVAIQSDGKIVAAVTVYNDVSGSVSMGILRCNADGSPDASFSSNGKQTIKFNDTGFDQAFAVAIQADQKIIVAGATILESTLQNAFAVARLNTDGSLDARFSRDGKVTTTFGNFRMAVYATTIAIQADTKIVVGGRANGNFALVRYFANGNLDLGFSGDGKQSTEFGGDDLISDIVIQPDNKILAAGSGNNKFALARYQPNGLLDSSFGVNGKQTTDIETGTERIGGIAISGSRLYAAGTGEGYTDVGVVAAYQLDETALVTKTMKVPEHEAPSSGLVVRTFPNPTTQHFTIQTRSHSATPISVRVTDAAGRVVDMMQNRPAIGSLQFGARYLPGAYYAEVRQGAEIKTLKLVKSRN